MKKTGFDKAQRTMSRLSAEVDEEFTKANRENGEEVLSLARVLIPERSGASRLAIRGFDVAGGGYLMDFGPKGKVIEGRRGPSPFANPALQATRDSRRKRNRKALRDAVKGAAGSG